MLFILFSGVIRCQPFSSATKLGPRNFEGNRLRDLYKQLSSHTQTPRVASLTDTAFTVLGRWAWGPCRAVEVTGDYALVGQGSVYQIFDLSNPAHPRVVYDTTLDDWVTDIKIKDSLLFILFNRSLMICRSSSLFPLVEIGRCYPGAGLFVDMAISDSLAFLLADFAGVVAINISDPTHPYFRDQFGLVDEFTASIASTGRLVYYGPYGPGFGLFILEYVPNAGFRVNELSIRGNAVSTYISDTLLFVGNEYGDSVGNLYGDLHIYTITDPWSPQFINSIDLGTPILRTIRKGDNIYCSTLDSGIVVLNISDLLHPVVVAKSHLHGGDKFARSDSVLVAATYTGVNFFSIPGADYINDLFFFATGGEPTDIVFKGNIGVVASGSAGLWSVDFSDPKHPRAIANVQGRDYYYVTLTGDLVCCVTIKNAFGIPDSLIICRLDDSGLLTRLSSIDVGGDARSVAARDHLVFVGIHGSIKILNVADSIHPYLLSSWDSVGDHRISVLGNYLLVARGVEVGFSILDISNLLLPQQIAHLSVDAVGILAADTLAYIGTQGLVIVNVTNPNSPVIVGNVGTPGTGDRAKLAKSRNFIYKTGIALDAIDISNTTHPVDVATLFPNSFPEGVAAKTDSVYVVSPYDGVWIVKNNLVTSVVKEPIVTPSEFALLQNYPNPFNPKTKIRFKLKGSGRSTLRVYSLDGKEIVTLVNEKMQPGEHEVEWDAKGFASGIYLYRLSEGALSQSKKLLLIK